MIKLSYDHPLKTWIITDSRFKDRIDDKIYSCHEPVVNPGKYAYIDNSRNYMMPSSVSATKCIDVSWPYSVSPSSGIIQPVQVCSKIPLKYNLQSEPLTPKIEDIKQESIQTQSPTSTTSFHTTASTSSPNNNAASETTRQTVLMWGSCNNNNKPNLHSYSHSPSSISHSTKSPTINPYDNNNIDLCKWNHITNNHESNRSLKDEDVSVISSQSSSPTTTASSKQGGNSSNGGSGNNVHQNSRIVMVL